MSENRPAGNYGVAIQTLGRLIGKSTKNKFSCWSSICTFANGNITHDELGQLSVVLSSIVSQNDTELWGSIVYGNNNVIPQIPSGNHFIENVKAQIVNQGLANGDGKRNVGLFLVEFLRLYNLKEHSPIMIKSVYDLFKTCGIQFEDEEQAKKCIETKHFGELNWIDGTGKVRATDFG